MFRVDVGVGMDSEFKAIAERSGDEFALRVVDQQERLKWIEELCDGRDAKDVIDQIEADFDPTGEMIVDREVIVSA